MSWQEDPTAHLSRDGRLRLVHGPIDLILRAEGPQDRVQTLYQRAQKAFAPLLSDLVAELPRLRSADGPPPTGPVASRMAAATSLFEPAFLTPMAAVAGAVADHVLNAVLVPGHGLASLHVNNGGDIALWTGGPVLTAAICEDPVTGRIASQAAIGPDSGIGGIATSGWRGRSHSLGIADSVTVLAATSAIADAAATLIANAVDLPGHPGVQRRPANQLSPDSDLGSRAVTIDVARLTGGEAEDALARGLALAKEYSARGLIVAAHLSCQGARRTVDARADANPPPEQTTRELSHA